jgi:hypothetical protein
MDGGLRFLQDLLRATKEGGANWLPLALIGLTGLLALLFIHLFVVILLTSAAFFIGKGVIERVIGPGTRIRLNIPWSRLGWPLWLSRLQKPVKRK